MAITGGIAGPTVGIVGPLPAGQNGGLPTGGTAGQPLVKLSSADFDAGWQTLGVPGGGTGLATLTSRGVLVGQGTSAITVTAAGAVNSLLQGAGPSADPFFTTTPNIGIATGTSLTLTTTGTEGSQLVARSTNAVTGRGGVIIQNTNGGGGFSIQQDPGGNVYIQNSGTANLIQWFNNTGSNVLQSSGTLAAGSFFVKYTTASTTSANGALVVTGGVGIGGALYVASNATVAGLEVTAGDVYISRTSNSTGFITRPNSAGFKNLTFAVLGNTPLDLVTANTQVFAISGTTVSSSTTTGALTVVGGVGIGGALNVGGATTADSLTINGSLYLNKTGAGGGIYFGNNAGNAFITAFAVNNTDNTLYMYSRGSGIDFRSLANASIMTLSNGGDLAVKGSTASTSSSTGALVVTGGAGIGGDAFVGGAFTSTGTNISFGGPSYVLAGDVADARWLTRLGAFQFSFQSGSSTDTTSVTGGASNSTVGGITYRTKAYITPASIFVGRGYTLQGATSGAANITVAAIAGTTNFQIPVGNGTANYPLKTDGSGNTRWEGPALTASTGTLTIVNAKTLTVNNSLTFAGTDSTTMTFPALSSNVLTTGNNATITKGYYVTPNNIGTVSSGTTTPDAANGNYQYYTNNGAHTLAAPSTDCAIDILITNGASAGAITFSGFTVGSSTGSSLTTTNTNKFVISIRRINGVSTYSIYALQ